MAGSRGQAAPFHAILISLEPDMRFYLVDRVTELNHGASIEGVKCWTLSDEIFQDHFPGMPIVPGVLLIESCAQLLGMLIEESYAREHPDHGRIYVILTMVHKAKFRTPVQPGDRCRLSATLGTLDINRATGSARVFLESQVVAEMDLSFNMIARDRLPSNEYLTRRDAEYRDVVLSRPQHRST